MFRHFLSCAALLGLLALPGTARPADAKKPAVPGVVVRVQSLDELMNNFRYLATLVGREEEAKQIEGWLKSKAGGPQGFEGVDAKRPFAGYGVFGEGGLEGSSAVVLIPIADEKAFVSLVENFNVKVEKGDDGVYTVTGDGLQVPVYFRFEHKHAYVTALNKDAIARDRILLPGAVLPAGKTPVLSVIVRLDQVPEKVREVALAQVTAQFDAAKEEKKPEQTPAQHAAQVEAVELMKNAALSVLKGGREVAFRLDVDQKAQEISAELALGGQSGSPLATAIADLGKRKSAVAGLVSPSSVLNVVVDLPLPPKLARALDAAIREQAEKDIAKEQDPAKKAQAEKAFRALAPALKFTDADLAVDLRGPGAGGLYTLVGGLKVADGAALEKALRDIVKDLPPQERAKVHLDADKAGDVVIHSVETKDDEGARKTFGGGPAYFAVRADAAFVAVGDGALAALKEALKAGPKVGKPAQVEISVARVAEVMGRDQPRAPEAAAKAFAKDKEADKVRFALEAGPELKLRFVMKTPVLTFLHLMEPKGDAK